MNKAFSLSLLTLLLLVSVKAASSETRVDVVVAGMITHGPMQPTIQAIKDVTSKYGDKVNFTWYNMETQEGQHYMTSMNLNAHLNILVNGKYQYLVNGKLVTFQWFEGQQWTKNDLDTVIASILNNTGQAVPNTIASRSHFDPLLIVIISGGAVVAAVAVFIILKRRRK